MHGKKKPTSPADFQKFVGFAKTFEFLIKQVL